jgi:TrkA domain protein
MDVTETMLPGVGMRYEFTTEHGELMGIIAYRNGKMDLLAYEDDDPDQAIGMVRMNRVEVETLAELLGAPRITARIADLAKEIPGLVSAHLGIQPNSPFAGKELGETHCRTETGASVVAIVRGDRVVSSPQPEEVLLADDVLVVIGTESGVDAVQDLLSVTSRASRS